MSVRENVPPRFPERLPGSLWGITSYFNFTGYGNKLAHYRRFRQSSRRQGLRLIAVELAVEERPFVLSGDDAEILVQVRGHKKNVMWQKEALLNIGCAHLPDDCDKVVWLDCDTLFKDDSWVKETAELLEKFRVVQPFSCVVHLPGEVTRLDDAEIDALPVALYDEMKKNPGFAFFHFTHTSEDGDPGHAWALRREIIRKRGFFDRLIMGGGDTMLACAFLGIFRESPWVRRQLNDKTLSSYMRWAEPVARATEGSVWYGNGAVLHLWHGAVANRMYDLRDALLRRYDFDPENDVRVSPDGLVEWASDKPELHTVVEEYFLLRNEEGAHPLLSFVLGELHAQMRETKSLKRKYLSVEHTRAYTLALALQRMHQRISRSPLAGKIVTRCCDKVLLVARDLKKQFIRKDIP